MSNSTAKQKVLEAIGKLPADATVEDAIEQLVLLAKIEEGLAQLDAGQGVGRAHRDPQARDDRGSSQQP